MLCFGLDDYLVETVGARPKLYFVPKLDFVIVLTQTQIIPPAVFCGSLRAPVIVQRLSDGCDSFSHRCAQLS